MTCKDAEKMIPIFIKNELNYTQLEQFMDHIDACPNCREEVSIQYLVTAGMVRLEEGSAFDLGRELDNLTQSSRAKIKRHKGMQYLGIGLEAAALLGIIAVILVILL